MIKTVYMWRREMTDKYFIGVEDCCNGDGICSPQIVYINYLKNGNYLDSFMTIEIDDVDTRSPFKDIEDARLFAQIIVKLLNKVGESCDIE